MPGWNAGHPSAYFYVNMGYGSQPVSMTNIMLPVFQMTGPSKDPYPGSFCLTDVPLPVNASLKAGDNATIQIIQVALHGASLYNVSFFFFFGDCAFGGCALVLIRGLLVCRHYPS